MNKKLRVEIEVPEEYVGLVKNTMLKAGYYAMSMKFGELASHSTPSPCFGCKHYGEGMASSCFVCSRIGTGGFDNYEEYQK